MTLQQLRYVCAVEKCGSITRAAQTLYVSQPAVSSTIRALEEELGITIFVRSPMGVTITKAGRDLVRMSNQLLSDADHIDAYFRSERNKSEHPRLLVSSQHYDFAVTAFTEYINEIHRSYPGYTLGLRETSTANVIEDVLRQHSSLGILYVPGGDRKYMERILTDRNLTFRSLKVAHPHAFLAKSHPLAGKDEVTPEELSEWPCLVYYQNEDSPSFYSEEILIPGISPEKIIYISDLYLSEQTLTRCHAYDIGTGIMNPELCKKIAAIPIRTDVTIDIGYIYRTDQQLGEEELRFIEILKSHLA